MTILNNPYLTIIVGVCSIKGRNIPLYGIIRVVKRGAAAMVVQWLWWRGGVWLQWWCGGCVGGGVWCCNGV